MRAELYTALVSARLKNPSIDEFVADGGGPVLAGVVVALGEVRSESRWDAYAALDAAEGLRDSIAETPEDVWMAAWPRRAPRAG